MIPINPRASAASKRPSTSAPVNASGPEAAAAGCEADSAAPVLLWPPPELCWPPLAELTEGMPAEPEEPVAWMRPTVGGPDVPPTVTPRTPAVWVRTLLAVPPVAVRQSSDRSPGIVRVHWPFT